MKLLFLTYRFPFPADRGDRLTVFNILRTLHGAGHEVTLVAFVDGTEPADGPVHVAPWCARIETVHLSRRRSWLQAWLGLASLSPSQVSYYRSRAMSETVRRILAEQPHDLVFAHMIRMAPYGAEARHPLKVFWVGDSLGLALRRSLPFEPIWKRPAIWWEAFRVDRFTGPVSRTFQDNWALSPDDLAWQRGLGVRNQSLITHGVDERLFDLRPRTPARPQVTFLGNLSVPHNIDAAFYTARELWPGIRARVPAARLVIAGADPVAAVRELAALPGVTVTGALPDLTPLWQATSVVVAPLRFSTGIQNKVLEPMAAGVPVVTNARVAEALEAKDGEHLLCAENTEAFVEAVARTLEHPEEARERVARARAHVRARFSWTTVVRRLETLVAERAASAAGSAPR